jgi:hypothetical protein
VHDVGAGSIAEAPAPPNALRSGALVPLTIQTVLAELVRVDGRGDELVAPITSGRNYLALCAEVSALVCAHVSMEEYPSSA